MGELLNIVVAVTVIALAVRWATTRGSDSNGQPTPASILGFRPKEVTDDMVENVQTMFPDIPRDNIRYDLLRSGSTEVTSNKILEKGFLDAPPASYYRIYPRTPAAPTTATSTAGSSSKPKAASLISKFDLQSRADDPVELSSLAASGNVSTKAAWEDSPEKRETSLRERKAQMILAARKRMLEQEKGKGKAVASGSGSGSAS